jgi:hypothetical protein
MAPQWVERECTIGRRADLLALFPAARAQIAALTR